MDARSRHTLFALRALLAVTLATLTTPRPALALLPEERGGALDAVAEVEATRRSLDALPALAAIEAELPWSPLDTVRARLAAVADDRATHPLVGARAGALVARLDRAAGRLAEATDRVRSLRLIDAWRVAPAAPGACEEALPPEPGADAWLDASGLTPEGLVVLDALVWPSDEGATFAATRLDADRATPSVLRLGAAGGVTVWVDGVVVLDEPGVRQRVLDQLTVPLPLAPGPHSLVVRVCPGEEHGPSLVARLTDGAGRPEPHVSWSVAPLDGGVTASGRPARARRVEDPFATFAERARAARTDAERRRAVRVLASYGRELPPELEPEALLGDDADSLLLRALLEDEANRRVELLRAVLDRDGERVRAMLELAEVNLGRQRYLAARALLDEAEARAPGLARTGVLRARLLSENQVAGEALRLLREAVDASPGVPAVLSALGSLAWQQNALGPAREAFEALARIAPDPTETGFWLFEIARLQGRSADALAAVDRLIAARPDVAGHRLMKARYLADLERPDEARAALAAIPATLRGSPDLLEGTGRLLHRLGDEEAALADLRESLRLRPQNPDLRAAIGRLQPDHGRPEDTWLEDAAAVVRSAPSDGPGAPDTEVLLDQTIVRVFPNGLSAATWQRVVRVNRVTPGDGTREVHIPYDPFKHAVDVLRAEVHGRDGVVRPVTEREEQSVSEAWYGLYYDLRHIVVPFRGLRDGDVLVLEHRVSDVGKNLIADSFSDLALLGDVAPKRRLRYVLLAPPGRALHSALVDPTGEAQWAEDEGAQGELLYKVWEVTDLPAIPVEDHMPGYAEVSPWVHVSTFASYDEVARTWWSLVEPQAQVTAAMRAHVRGLVEGIDDPLERVRRVHDDLVRSNRYVGLEFGIHGYKPYPSSQVFERRFGDCKDQSLLLKVMLAEVGIESRLVLVRTRSLGRVPAAPASLEVFDHAILQVPSLGLWLDPTADRNGLWELPAEDQGATALVVGPEGGTLLELPESEALDNVRSRVFEVEPGRTGDAVRGRLQAAGLFAPELRKAYRTRATREAVLGEQLSAVFPGYRLGKATFAGVEELGATVDITYEGTAPEVTEAAGGAVVLVPPDPADELLRRLAPDPDREQDLLLDFPYVDRRVERLIAPEGWAPAVEPREEVAESPFGTFTVRVGADGRAAVRERTLELRARRVDKDDWEAFRDFLRHADALGHTPIAVRPGGQS